MRVSFVFDFEDVSDTTAHNPVLYYFLFKLGTSLITKVMNKNPQHNKLYVDDVVFLSAHTQDFLFVKLTCRLLFLAVSRSNFNMI